MTFIHWCLRAKSCLCCWNGRACLQVPPGYRFAAAPLALESTVVTGFGRGSRQLGVPTANMDPAPLAQQLQQLPQGVYFGWAQLDPPEGWPAADAAVHKMVMNVGRRPTVNTGTCWQLAIATANCLSFTRSGRIRGYAWVLVAKSAQEPCVFAFPASAA